MSGEPPMPTRLKNVGLPLLAVYDSAVSWDVLMSWQVKKVITCSAGIRFNKSAQQLRARLKRSPDLPSVCV